MNREDSTALRAINAMERIADALELQALAATHDTPAPELRQLRSAMAQAAARRAEAPAELQYEPDEAPAGADAGTPAAPEAPASAPTLAPTTP
jgi:hypothetical protein